MKVWRASANFVIDASQSWTFYDPTHDRMKTSPSNTVFYLQGINK